MVFKGFDKNALLFLDEIKENNNKIWFEDNRHRWKSIILEPNIAYIEEMGEHLIALVPTIKAIPKVSGSLFRIYRDIRFSKDKTPIKTKIGLMFWQGNTHRMQSACFYMQYTSTEIYVASGIRVFKTPLLKAYREYIQIKKNAQELHEILEELKEMGIKITPAHYKRFPKDFDTNDEYAYLSLYNGLFVYKTFKPNKTFLSTKIINHNYNFYEKTLRLHEWLYELSLKTKES